MVKDDDKDEMGTGEESFADLFEKSIVDHVKLEPGQKVDAKILKISGEWVFLDMGRKGEGVLEKKELLSPEGELSVKDGDTIPVWFVGVVNNELRFTTRVGTGSAGKSQLEDAWRSGIPVEGLVEKEIKGGFEIKVGGTVRAFCPYSQISLRRIENAAEYTGKHLPFKITEYAEGGRNIVVSHRALLKKSDFARKRSRRRPLKRE